MREYTSALAREFGVNRSTIYNVRDRVFASVNQAVTA